MRAFRPDFYAPSICAVTAEFLRGRGVRGVILDIDNTLIGHNVPIPDAAVMKTLDSYRAAGIALCIVSNNREARVRDFCAKIGVEHYVFDALKPSRRGYRAAAERMQLPLSALAAIGDQIFTDVWGARRAGCMAILTKPLHEGRETAFIALKRLAERPFIPRAFSDTQGGAS